MSVSKTWSRLVIQVGIRIMILTLCLYGENRSVPTVPMPACHYLRKVKKHSVMAFTLWCQRALWVKSIKQTENSQRTTQTTRSPTSPLLCLGGGSLLYLQMNQSVSQTWAVCLHKHRLLTRQRRNKETNSKTKQKKRSNHEKESEEKT